MATTKNRRRNLSRQRLPSLARLRVSVTRAAVGALLFLGGVSFLPYRWCSRGADDWYAGNRELQIRLGRAAEAHVRKGLTRLNFDTGSAQFNGEWLFGTYLMAGLGFGQTALEHPELRPKHLALMRLCIERLLSPEVRAFDRESWRSDPLESLDGDAGHAAYLGYLNLLLSHHRLLAPQSEYAALNDRITAALVRRFEQSPIRLIESYPQEVYPVDNCAAIGSIGLHARATGADRGEFLGRWAAHLRGHCVDRQTGLLYQCVDPSSGKPVDYPRGSGTCLGLYFLSFADSRLSRDMFTAVRRELVRPVFGFGGIREYPASVRGEAGDIDAGPVVLGFGLSATGFGIAGCRIHGDADCFRRLYATACAWGAPYATEGRLTFVTGGPLGDAILFAMLTAQPAGRFDTQRPEGRTP